PEVIPENKGHHKRLVDDRRGCLCCHCVQSGEILAQRYAGIPMDDRQLWVFPMPDLLGITLDPNEMATVSFVAAGTEGAKAGFKARDRIVKMKGQLILSIADVTWVLNVTKAPAKMRVEVDRGGKIEKLSLSLPKGWRRRAEYSWRRAVWPLRQRILGIVTEVLPPADRSNLGLPPDTMAIRIKNVVSPNVKKSNPSGRKIKLMKGDVIVEVDRSRKPMNESEFLAYAIQKKRPGQKVHLTVLRGGAEKRFQLTVQ
ncbi:MAG: PDZ domain-containing protein, partial [Planctomycetota bacterium]